VSRTIYRPFAPRPIRALEPVLLGAHTLKRYWIDRLAAPQPEPADWTEALRLVAAALPRTPDAARPDVGFLIQHRGYGADYVVLGWWARENELPLRIFVRYPETDDAIWRPAHGEESLCVWDLQAIAHERDVYVAAYLAGLTPEAARERYLGAQLRCE
jgi:hypothetical protein